MNLKKFLKIILAILIAVILGYMLLNANAVYQKTVYLINPEKDNQISEALIHLNSSSQEVQAIHTISNEIPENWLSCPELDIKAPIFWDISDTDSNSKMNFGLVHIKGTAIPGSAGVGLISGHSSQYWWQSGNYKTIFVNLTKAKIGDKFIIHKDGLRVYEVESIKTVNSNNYLEYVLEGPEKIQLMTCVPIGTNLKRFIVEAKLVGIY